MCLKGLNAKNVDCAERLHWFLVGDGSLLQIELQEDGCAFSGMTDGSMYSVTLVGLDSDLPNLPASLASTETSGTVSDPTSTTRYHALVIGNDLYAQFPGLGSCVHDAEDMAALLASNGYAVTTVLNGTKVGMEVGLQRFVASLQDGCTAVVFFSGHGLSSPTTDPQEPIESCVLPVDGVVPGETGGCRVSTDVLGTGCCTSGRWPIFLVLPVCVMRGLSRAPRVYLHVDVPPCDCCDNHQQDAHWCCRPAN